MSTVTKPLDLIYAIWHDLREYIDTNDRSEPIEAIISILNDHNFSSEEQHDAFKHDPEVDNIVSTFFDEELDDDGEEDPDNLDSYFFDPTEEEY